MFDALTPAISIFAERLSILKSAFTHRLKGGEQHAPQTRFAGAPDSTSSVIHSLPPDHSRNVPGLLKLAPR